MFNGKTALITGSTSGIGLGIAQALAARGAHIVLNGFGDAAQIAQLRADIAREHGVQVLYDGADMSRVDAIEAMMRTAIGEFGAIDLLINNAGIQHVAPVDEFPLEKWSAILAINLSAAFHTTRLALPLMKQRGFGRIVNVASAHALVASPYKSAYVAAKHGVLGFSGSLLREVKGRGVKVMTLTPGIIDTYFAGGTEGSRDPSWSMSPRFVADFVGSSNVLEPSFAASLGGTATWTSLRPERIRILGIADDVPVGYGSLEGIVTTVHYQGASTRFEIDHKGARLTVSAPAGRRVVEGERLEVCWPLAAMHAMATP